MLQNWNLAQLKELLIDAETIGLGISKVSNRLTSDEINWYTSNVK